MGISWGEHLATGIEEIDAQHRELFRRLNAFLDACDAGKEKKELVGMLQFLDDYVVVHFRAEERLQELYGYSDRARHREYHRGFVGRLTDLKRRFLLEGPTSSLVKEINRTVVGWLLDHIAEKDRHFGAAVRNKGKYGE
jgi:hemerythrin